MYDARDVRAALQARAAEVCRFLLPSGRLDGNKWRVGSWDDEKGDSMVVDLTGPYAGCFKDFAAQGEGESGDLLKLWMHRRGVDFRRAIEEIARELGVTEVGSGWRKAESGKPQATSVEKKAVSEGELAKMFRPVEEGSAVWKWLVEKRKLTAETIRNYGIGEARRKWRDEQEHDFCVFPYRDQEGKLALLKFRDIAEKKNMWTWPRLTEGGRVILFGSNLVGDRQDLIITEGELDAMALDVYGYVATSLPFGAQAVSKEVQDDTGRRHKWIEEQMSWLEGFKTVYLAGDMDETGRKAWGPVISRLGDWRVSLVNWPDGHKDADECLMFGVEKRAIDQAIRKAHGIEPEQLVRPEDVRDRILDLYFPEDRQVEQGDLLPWTFPEEFRFRPGELTVWQGYTGSGKTQVLNNLLVNWATKLNRRFCVASLEVDAADTFWYMARIWAGKRRPDGDAEFNRQMEFLTEYASAYYHVGAAPLEDVLKIFEYEIRRRGAWHLVLDSLMRVDGVKSDDYDAQKAVCDKCIELARRYQVHVHLVCHSKKPDQRHPVEKCWPSKYDISGSAALANLPHNIVCVWRNKGKENALNEAGYMPDDEEKRNFVAQWVNREDSLLIVQKNRKSGGEGEKRLWFDPASCRFREDRQAGPTARPDVEL